ncbi:UDP-N-acetylmuramate dehydrogenase [Zunongwangia atlantica]|uniref:UDP-N-acetylenolpyruvoylglucosamine reductase n=1 Tax=Zunongwangia atlantica 22II14-10F7 TaxID=1185767 RepID=A0A1Y1SZF0_9FLAO|nr:FAD-binding protein [Zunongwangia atlantica]ORL43725.1 UDP-N-acetylenolpyruvoylglucosamine reductase [Zunongwangia atlantica 22II14-10F7]
MAIVNVPELKGFLLKANINYEEDVELSKITYLRTGGTADYIIFPRTNEEVCEAIKILNSLSVKFKIIGATSNLLFLDDKVYSCLLSTERLKGMFLNKDTALIEAASGDMLPELSRFALLHSSKGFEGLEGIPGTVGGAVFMNAGAYGYEIKNVLEFIEMVDFEGNLKKIDKVDLKLGKRISSLRKGDLKGVIVKCYFKYQKGNTTAIAYRMENYHAKRHKYQDFLYPSLGSIFSGQIYKALGEKDRYFKVVSAFFYLFRYKWKIFHKESPLNRKWINDLAVKRFKLNYDLQPFSDKTINCLVNRGQGTDEMVNYIRKIEELTDGKIPVENEIVEEF